MKIYSPEQSLASLMQSDNKTTSSLVVPIAISEDKNELFIENLTGIQQNGCSASVSKALEKAVAEMHPDLVYGSAILVSTVMNKNDDVFLPEETWSARNTPVNTPYNDEHVETDIIGHIIASRPLDSEGKLITSDEPPKYFDIEVDFVIYKGIFPAVAKDILDKAAVGEKFVSMEAKFNDFDYALVNPKGEYKIIGRNEETAFLTKYLRSYGGEGKYQDYKVARVLKDFRFTGMGSVETPANPGSEYTKFEQYEFAAASNIIESPERFLYLTKGKVMEINTIEEAKQVIADLNEKLTKFEGQETETLKAQVQATKDSLTAETEKVSLATQKISDLETEKANLTQQLEDVKAQLAAKTLELDKINKESVANDRVAQLKELGAEITDEKKVEIAEWSEATFATVVEFTKTLKPKQEGDPAGADEAARKAQEALASADKGEVQLDVSKTPGDNSTEAEKINKVAATMIQSLRDRNKNHKPKTKA